MAKKSKEEKVGPRPGKIHLDSISSYILDGLSVEEACVLCGYPFKDFVFYCEEDPDIAEFINKKNIEFKHKHLKNILSKPSEKTSQWILEKLRPKEFGAPKVAGQPEGQVNIVAAIIGAIRKDYSLAEDVAAGDPGSELGLTSRSLTKKPVKIREAEVTPSLQEPNRNVDEVLV